MIAKGQAAGAFRKDVNPTLAAKLFFGMLDEMATNWILSKRQYSLANEVGGDRRSLRPRRRGGAGVMRIRSAAVLGAGTMGAQIAAHLANAGVPSLLLDVSLDAARAGPEAGAGAQARSVLHQIHGGAHPAPAAFDDLAGAAIVRLDHRSGRRTARRQAGADRTRRTSSAAADAIVTSNTSGIPIARIAEGRSDAFRQRWLGTHFFNPPRYLQLLEVIPTADTDPAVRPDA